MKDTLRIWVYITVLKRMKPQLCFFLKTFSSLHYGNKLRFTIHKKTLTLPVGLNPIHLKIVQRRIFINIVKIVDLFCFTIKYVLKVDLFPMALRQQSNPNLFFTKTSRKLSTFKTLACVTNKYQE